MQSLADVQRIVLDEGPWLARRNPKTSRKIVKLFLRHWGDLTDGTEGERLVAGTYVTEAVKAESGWFLRLLVPILVRVLWEYLVSRYNNDREFRGLVDHVRSGPYPV